MLPIPCIVAATAQRNSASAPLTAPVNTSLPTIDNTSPQVGDALTADPGTWTGSPTLYTYQWSNDFGPIVGGTTQFYTAQSADLGSGLQVTVTAYNDAGNNFISSLATSAVVPPPPINIAPPNITSSGDVNNPHVGDTLTVDNGTWDVTVNSFFYQWEASGSSPTNTYTILDGDVGFSIQAVVTAENAGGNTASGSNTLPPVT